MPQYGPVKPHAQFHVAPHAWRRLDTPRIVAAANGHIDYEVYLHIGYRLIRKDHPGMLRVKIVREAFRGEPVDPTGYDHVWLPVGGEHLWIPYTGTPWENAQKGRDVWVEVQTENANVTIGTRYFKGHQR